MDEESARKIIHFYKECTDEEEAKDLLLKLKGEKDAARIFDFKDGEVKIESWSITKLEKDSRLINNIVTNNTFKDNENKIKDLYILIPNK